jgi:integrase
MKIEWVGRDRVRISYRMGEHHIRRVIGVVALTEFLTGAACEAANLGAKGIVTFEKFCAEHYLPKDAKHRLKERTYTREKDLIKALGKYFGPKQLDKISREDWETYSDMRLTGKLSVRGKACAQGTVKKEFKSLRMILAYAAELGFIQKNVVAGVKTDLSDGNRADIWLTREEIARFLSKIPEAQRIFRDLFEFRIWTGARPEEAEQFSKNNLSWESEEIWILTGKRRKKDAGVIRKRYFKIKSLGPRFEELLRNLKPHPATGLYFCHPETGLPYSHRYVVKVFDKAIEAAGITKRASVTPYDLRGTFATHRAMVVDGFRQLQVEMGHLSPKSIEHYLAAASHYRPEDSIFYSAKLTDSERKSNET